MQQVQLLHPFEENEEPINYDALFERTYGITCLTVSDDFQQLFHSNKD